MARWPGALIVSVIILTSLAAFPAGAQDLSPQLSQTRQPDAKGTNIRGAVEDSIRFLMIEHAVRISVQEKTRQALGGPFFTDYTRSVRIPGQWGDTDSWPTNYIGHPGQGAASGYIWLQRSPDGEMPISMTSEYFNSRLRAMAWAAGYSVQFEVGPFSEASIGNVGMNPQTAGWVDYIATPVGGFGIMIAEDLLDRFVVQKLEARTDSKVIRAMLRMLLNPSRTTANVAGMRTPWHRIGRPISD